MVTKKTKINKGKQRKPSKTSNRVSKAVDRRSSSGQTAKGSRPTLPELHVAVHSPQQPAALIRPVFSIEIGSIGGDTTIGDLIVAFPRTRDVLMKHGLRFDVEEAGYLYMTLNVFSAIHGLTTNSLVQELHAASKEPPPAIPSTPLRPIATAPPA